MKFNELKRFEVPLVYVLRLLVGVVFVVSGFAKAIDPWGTVYKLTDYLGILHLDSLTPYVTFGAFALPVVESLLGVFILFGLYRRFAPLLLTAVMVVMTAITFYLAVTDRMADCGCFGDVLVLSNWATFFKNVLLLAASVCLLLRNRIAKNIYGVGVQWVVWTFTMMLILSIEYYGYVFQPLIDFRPFKVGTHLYEGPSADGDDDSDKFVFIYSKDGVEREFTLDSLPDDTWEYVDRRVSDGVEESVVKHITVFDGGFDVTAEVLNPNSEQLIFTFPDMENISISFTYLINELNEFAHKHGVTTFGVTSGSKAQIDDWKDISLAQYPMYGMDDTDMKMLARGNPAVVYVKNGVIMWKRALRSISSERVQANDADMMSIASDYDSTYHLRWLLVAYALLMILLLMVNRLHRVVKFTMKRIRKNGKKEVTLQKENEEL
ncbi:MAG: BT_3928 family protein [Muribaculaceae bacterium]